MERKLVSIQEIIAVLPIAGADNIMQARVMGWTVVIKKGELAVGDRCVFFEIDSVLPEGPAWSEFMRARKFRVRTLKLRGVLSQGLALPVSILDGTGGDVPELGVDVSDRLGVTKFEPVLPDSREMAGSFPTQVPKTDEIRLQSALGVLEEIAGRDFYVATKLDGSSATYFQGPGGRDGFTACSRNWALRRGRNDVWRAAERYRLDEVLPEYLAVQGELCGPGIQKNRLGLTELDLFIFSAYDARRGAFLGYRELVETCGALGLKMVPVEKVVTGDEARTYAHSLEGWLEAASGLYPGTKNRKEGIVVRPLEEQPSAVLGGRMSFKVINNDFLLKDED
jgi:RNA ligase (TIGR02306 family)